MSVRSGVTEGAKKVSQKMAACAWGVDALESSWQTRGGMGKWVWLCVAKAAALKRVASSVMLARKLHQWSRFCWCTADWKWWHTVFHASRVSGVPNLLAR